MSMCCKGKRDRDDAVSELVGEMLMLTIVLILLAIFSATASNYLPPPRDPSVTIVPGSAENLSGGIDVHLYHKGGDWIKTSDLTVILLDDDNYILKYSATGTNPFILKPDSDSQSFDLGDWIVISDVEDKWYEVRLVTPRAVVFSGEVQPFEK